jgi:hypothetical protein
VSVVGVKKLDSGAQLFVDRSINYGARPVHHGCVRGSIVLSATLVEPTKKDGMFQVTFLSWLDMKVRVCLKRFVLLFFNIFVVFRGLCFFVGQNFELNITFFCYEKKTPSSCYDFSVQI